MVVKVLANALHQLHLLFCGQTVDRALNDAPKRLLVDRNEAVIVHVGKETHDELTVHAVSDTTMTRDRVTEILDLEGALEARCEEATEWRDEGSESSEDQNVDLHRSHVERLNEREPDWKMVKTWKENRVWCALETGPDICAKILQRVSNDTSELSQRTDIDWANEVFVSHQDIGHANSKYDCEDPSANKSFNRLLWR